LTGGGGGYGDPLERDPERVRWDVQYGYVTPQAAEAVYGVVLEPQDDPDPVDGDWRVNEAATAKRRAELRREQEYRRLLAVPQSAEAVPDAAHAGDAVDDEDPARDTDRDRRNQA